MQWKDTAGEFELPPLGVHVARCFALIDLGTRSGPYGSKHQVMIKWELPMEMTEKGRPHEVAGWYTQSLAEKANLRNMLRSWRGKDFTPEQLKGFDAKSILGVPAMVNITEKAKDGGGVRHVVSSVTPLPKGITCPAPANEPIFVSLRPEDFLAADFSKIADKLQEEIKETPEWKALNSRETQQWQGAFDDGPPPIDDDVPF